jgi:hypothetical protein
MTLSIDREATLPDPMPEMCTHPECMKRQVPRAWPRAADF